MPPHDSVGHTSDPLGVGRDFRNPQAADRARIATVECLQVTVDVRSVRVSERRFDEASADAPPLGRGCHADRCGGIVKAGANRGARVLMLRKLNHTGPSNGVAPHPRPFKRGDRNVEPPDRPMVCAGSPASAPARDHATVRSPMTERTSLCARQSLDPGLVASRRRRPG